MQRLCLGWMMAWMLGGCGDNGTDGASQSCPETDELDTTLSGAVCDSSVSYEEDIAPLMEKYCTSCHDSSLKGTSARHCAPADHNFDTEDGLIDEAHHVDLSAAAGPDAVHTQMPPKGYPAPTQAEREMVGAWLACHADVATDDDDD